MAAGLVDLQGELVGAQDQRLLSAGALGRLQQLQGLLGEPRGALHQVHGEHVLVSRGGVGPHGIAGERAPLDLTILGDRHVQAGRGVGERLGDVGALGGQEPLVLASGLDVPVGAGDVVRASQRLDGAADELDTIVEADLERILFAGGRVAACLRLDRRQSHPLGGDDGGRAGHLDGAVAHAAKGGGVLAAGGGEAPCAPDEGAYANAGCVRGDGPLNPSVAGFHPLRSRFDPAHVGVVGAGTFEVLDQRQEPVGQVGYPGEMRALASPLGGGRF